VNTIETKEKEREHVYLAQTKKNKELLRHKLAAPVMARNNTVLNLLESGRRCHRVAPYTYACQPALAMQGKGTSDDTRTPSEQ
jgi:hypothetical protein